MAIKANTLDVFASPRLTAPLDQHTAVCNHAISIDITKGHHVHIRAVCFD